MLKIRVIPIADLAAWQPLLNRGLSEWEKTDEAMMAGERTDSLIFQKMLTDGKSELLVFEIDGASVGFSLVGTLNGWLIGHMTWLDPDWRGKGLWKEVANVVEGLVYQRGLHGEWFCSTLPIWESLAPACGFVSDGVLEQDGVTGRCWRKEVPSWLG